MSKYSGTINLEVMAEAVNYNKFLTSLVFEKIKKTDQILDFGAGTGTFSKKIHDSGFKLKAYEIDLGLLKGLKKLGLIATSNSSTLKGKSFDFIYSFNVLEHIDDDVAALKELKRLLKPRGLLLIYVPAFMCLFSSMDIRVGHVRRYSKSELLEKIKIAGFKVQSVRYVDSIGFFASLVYKLLSRNSGLLNIKSIIFYDQIIFPLSRICDTFLSLFIGKNLMVYAVND
ncbi:class I SAM-dependent methyltransferase [Candidatus Methylopumilus planktonicus]|uniref:class I SAM-dependent methyltransferase n=1 Tax=Candidatus Methylopumilus planktonicus TaxID=1581557 RepID=UPI0011217BD8|nr:class I SAM-dependent methyltransferase [Candidatus Methylopumilus planktonicus]QDD01783.1 class I SAM-dependent methyltransferase [Candidatus Methylopumilus planktonicus]